MAIAGDTLIEATDHTPTGLREARGRALCAARKAYSAGRFGSRHLVHYDEVVYVVERDGISRLLKGPDGRTLKESRV